MSVRMIPNSVIGGANFRSELRVLFNVPAKNEKRRGHPVFFEQCEQLSCDSRIRSIIISESARISCTAQRRSKQLGSRVHVGPRRQSESGDGWNEDLPRAHSK